MTIASRWKPMLLIALFAVAALPALVWAGEASWATSYTDAVAASRKTGKPILADFTGSDWCTWCQKLDEEVFSTTVFQDWAGKNVILLKLDFPKHKTIPAAERQQNVTLAQKYGIRGFPTVLLLTADGQVMGRTGYQAGGAKKWVANAKGLIASYRKANELQVASSLEAAVAEAAKTGRPLLVVTARSTQQAKSQQDGLFQHKPFVHLANDRLVVGHAVTAGSDAATTMLAKLRSRLGVKDGATWFLADAKASKLLAEGDTLAKPQAFVVRLKDALPKITYDGSWLTDYRKARMIAEQDGRVLFLDFTGSDWCYWCKKLDAEVFSKQAFQEYARKHLVLVKLDFPKQKQLSDAQKQQNVTLARKYGIRGFPTIILLDSTGQKIGQMGYMQGGPDAFLGKLRPVVAEANGGSDSSGT